MHKDVDDLWEEAEGFTLPYERRVANRVNAVPTNPTRDERLKVLLIQAVLKVAAALERRS